MTKTLSATALILLALTLVFAEPLPRAAVSTITPASGLTRGGEIVHIHGTNLRQSIECANPTGCTTIVTFGGAPAEFIGGITPDEVVVLAPPHAAGAVDVQVTVPGQGVVTLPAGYIYEAAQDSDRVRLLIPIAISASGALNTSWQTDILVHNDNAELLVVENASGPGGDVANVVTPAEVPPFSTVAIKLSPPSGNAGAFVYVPRRLADNTQVSVRVHDTSRDADSWGTEVPVVPEGQFRRSVVLVGVPTDPRFRTLLRIYAYTVGNAEVIVRLRDDVTGELLATRALELTSGSLDVTNPAVAAAYGQLSLEGIVAPFAASHPRLRAEIAPTGPRDAPLWAFISVTNNTTQQVTTLTPGIVPTAVAIPTVRDLPLGHWGSAEACVDITNTQVTVNFHCGVGVFPLPLPDVDGRFEADGTFENLSPLPTGQKVPAHFSGVHQGNLLTIRERVGNTSTVPVTVQFGFTGPCATFPCPISDDPLSRNH